MLQSCKGCSSTVNLSLGKDYLYLIDYFLVASITEDDA